MLIKSIKRKKKREKKTKQQTKVKSAKFRIQEMGVCVCLQGGRGRVGDGGGVRGYAGVVSEWIV